MGLPAESLPSWECGLKFDYITSLDEYDSSLPSWECGLKSVSITTNCPVFTSLPSWECGLKLSSHFDNYSRDSHSLRGSVD